MSNTDAILAEIDDVLTDWHGSADSAIWRADGNGPDDLNGEADLPAACRQLTTAMFTSMEQFAASYRRSLEQVSDQVSRFLAEVGPVTMFKVTALRPGVDITCWACAGHWRSERCRTCHPLAFPLPVPSGSEYHRRQRARKRRSR